MRRSEKRILTTHTGSLPRPDDLGEAGKVGDSTYVMDRMTGFDDQGSVPPLGDLVDFPEYALAA